MRSAALLAVLLVAAVGLATVERTLAGSEVAPRGRREGLSAGNNDVATDSLGGTVVEWAPGQESSLGDAPLPPHDFVELPTRTR
jgi:hypothetical protein